MDEREALARRFRLLDRMKEERLRAELVLDQTQHRQDLGLGYLIYSARRFSRLSQSSLGERIGSSQSTISKWERNERLPSLRALQTVASAAGLELVLGLRDPTASDIEEEFITLAVSREEGRATELDLFIDRYHRDYIPPRPWRAEVEALLESRPRPA